MSHKTSSNLVVLVLILVLTQVRCNAIDEAAGLEPSSTNPDYPTAASVAQNLKGDNDFIDLLVDILVDSGTIGTGASGAKGDKGDTGPTGPKGDQGEVGPQGVKGDMGEKGDKGDTGPMGPKGDQGKVGLQGPQGSKGDKGEKGDPGTPGTSNHGNLSGLEGDDHPQYLKVTRLSSGAQYNGKLEIRNSGSSANIQLEATDGSGSAALKYTSNKVFEVIGENEIQLQATFGAVVLDESGNNPRPIKASSFDVISSRDLKEDISKLDAKECSYWLSEVTAFEPATYRFVHHGNDTDEFEQDRIRLGLIADELPPILLGHDGASVDLYALTTALVASVKELSVQVKEQQREIAELKHEIAKLSE